MQMVPQRTIYFVGGELFCGFVFNLVCKKQIIGSKTLLFLLQYSFWEGSEWNVYCTAWIDQMVESKTQAIFTLLW